MQNAGLQYGEGVTPVQESPFVTTAVQNTSSNSTSSLRQFRKKENVDKAAGANGGLSAANQDSTNSSHVARVAPHNHYPHKQNEYFRYPPQYQEYSSPYKEPTVKYSEIAEPVIQPIPHLDHLPPSVLTKHKEKEYVEMCNIPQQSHLNKPYSEHQFNGQQGYPPEMSMHNQYMHKEPQSSQMHSPYKPESQYIPKEGAFNHQIPPFLKYNIPQTRNYGHLDNSSLTPFQRMDPHLTRSFMADHHHIREFPTEYSPMEQSRMYAQKQRYYPTPLPPSTSSYPPNYPPRNIPAQQYNYPSCNYPRSAQMNSSMGRYSMNMERSISPRRTYPENMEMAMNFPSVPQKIPANYSNYPAYAQHYQQRRPPAVSQEYYHPQQHPHPRAHAQYLPNHHPQEMTENHVASNNIRQYLENWAEEEPVSDIPTQIENPKYISRINRDDSNEVYVINASELPQYLENGVPLIASENGQYIFKSNVSIDNTGAIKIIDKTVDNSALPTDSQDRVVSLHIIENPKADCVVNNRSTNVNPEHQVAANQSSATINVIAPNSNHPNIENTAQRPYNQSGYPTNRMNMVHQVSPIAQNPPQNCERSINLSLHHNNSSSPHSVSGNNSRSPGKGTGSENDQMQVLSYNEVPQQNSCIVVPSGQNRLNFDESLLPNPVPCNLKQKKNDDANCVISNVMNEEAILKEAHEELDKIVQDTLTSTNMHIPLDSCDGNQMPKIGEKCVDENLNSRIPDYLNLDLDPQLKDTRTASPGYTKEPDENEIIMDLSTTSRRTSKSENEPEVPPAPTPSDQIKEDIREQISEKKDEEIEGAGEIQEDDTLDKASIKHMPLIFDGFEDSTLQKTESGTVLSEIDDMKHENQGSETASPITDENKQEIDDIKEEFAENKEEVDVTKGKNESENETAKDFEEDTCDQVKKITCENEEEQQPLPSYCESTTESETSAGEHNDSRINEESVEVDPSPDEEQSEIISSQKETENNTESKVVENVLEKNETEEKTEFGSVIEEDQAKKEILPTAERPQSEEKNEPISEDKEENVEKKAVASIIPVKGIKRKRIFSVDDIIYRIGSTSSQNQNISNNNSYEKDELNEKHKCSTNEPENASFKPPEVREKSELQQEMEDKETKVCAETFENETTSESTVEYNNEMPSTDENEELSVKTSNTEKEEHPHERIEEEEAIEANGIVDHFQEPDCSEESKIEVSEIALKTETNEENSATSCVDQDLTASEDDTPSIQVKPMSPKQIVMEECIPVGVSEDKSNECHQNQSYEGASTENSETMLSERVQVIKEKEDENSIDQKILEVGNHTVSVKDIEKNTAINTENLKRSITDTQNEEITSANENCSKKMKLLDPEPIEENQEQEKFPDNEENSGEEKKADETPIQPCRFSVIQSTEALQRELNLAFSPVVANNENETVDGYEDSTQQKEVIKVKEEKKIPTCNNENINEEEAQKDNPESKIKSIEDQEENVPLSDVEMMREENEEANETLENIEESVETTEKKTETSSVNQKKSSKEEISFEQRFIEPLLKNNTLEMPQKNEGEEDKSPVPNYQYRSVLKIEENVVLLEICGELVEITVNQINGKKVITVLPISSSAIVDINDNYEHSDRTQVDETTASCNSVMPGLNEADMPELYEETCLDLDGENGEKRLPLLDKMISSSEDEDNALGNEEITSTQTEPVENHEEIFEDIILNENEIIIGDESLEEEINLDLKSDEVVLENKPTVCTKAAMKLYEDVPIQLPSKTQSSLREFRKIKNKPDLEAQPIEKIIDQDGSKDKKCPKGTTRTSTRQKSFSEQKEESQVALQELVKQRKMRKEKIRLKYSQYVVADVDVTDQPHANSSNRVKIRKEKEVKSEVRKISKIACNVVKVNSVVHKVKSNNDMKKKNPFEVHGSKTKTKETKIRRKSADEHRDRIHLISSFIVKEPSSNIDSEKKKIEEKPTSTSHTIFNPTTAPKDTPAQNFQEVRTPNTMEVAKNSGIQENQPKFPKVSVPRDLSLTKNINEHYLSRKDHSNLKKKLSIQEYNSRKRKTEESKISTPVKVAKLVHMEESSILQSEEKNQSRPSTIYSGRQFENISNCVKDPRRLQFVNTEHPGLLRSNSEESTSSRIPNISSLRSLSTGTVSNHSSISIDLMLNNIPIDNHNQSRNNNTSDKPCLYADKSKTVDTTNRRTSGEISDSKYESLYTSRRKVSFDDNVQINEIHTTQTKAVKVRQDSNSSYCEVTSSCSDNLEEKLKDSVDSQSDDRSENTNTEYQNKLVKRIQKAEKFRNDWEDSNSPKDCITDAFADSFLDKNKLETLKNTTKSKLIIDINDFDTRLISNEMKSSHNNNSNPISCEEGLKNYKEEVDLKLNSLNIQIPKTTKNRVFNEDDVLMHKFLRKEQLSSEEIKQIRRIIYFKKKMQQLQLSQQNMNCNTKITEDNYEIKKSPENSVNKDLKLQLKKVDGKIKKKKKRFRNLYSDSPETSENEVQMTAGEFSVYEGENISGVKLIFKRKTDFLNLHPVVKIQRCQYIDSMAKKLKFE